MEIIDNVNKTPKDDMLLTLYSGSKVAIAVSCFSIYAFQELKELLKDIDKLRLISTSPSFLTEKADKQNRKFCIIHLNYKPDPGVHFKQCNGECKKTLRFKGKIHIPCLVKDIDKECNEKLINLYNTQYGEDVCKETMIYKVEAMLS